MTFIDFHAKLCCDQGSWDRHCDVDTCFLDDCEKPEGKSRRENISREKELAFMSQRKLMVRNVKPQAWRFSERCALLRKYVNKPSNNLTEYKQTPSASLKDLERIRKDSSSQQTEKEAASSVSTRKPAFVSA